MQVSIREQIRRYKRQDLRRRLNTDACPQLWLQSTTVGTGGWMIEKWNQSPQSEKPQSKLRNIVRGYFCLFLSLPVNNGCRSWAGPFHGNRFSLGWNGWGEFISRKRLGFQLCSYFLSKECKKFFSRHFMPIPRWASWRFLQRWPTQVQQDWLSLSTSQVRITLYYILYIRYLYLILWYSRRPNNCNYLLSFSSKCNVRRDPTGAVLGHGGGEVPRVRRKCEIVWRMWKCLNVASLQCRDPYMVIAEKAGSTFSPFWGNIFRLVVINNGTSELWLIWQGNDRCLVV